MAKAIVLFSGGLDSLLALRIIKDSGVELLALNFLSPFCRCNRADGCSAIAQLKKIGVNYRFISLKEEYLEIVKKPKFGYGSNVNPCLDCRIMMFKKAKQIMAEADAKFIITGEVMGQRPMSQQRRQLELIEKETDLCGLILRPLSARLLPETVPEKEGWIKREVLLDLNGRTRTPQIKLAKELGVRDYPCPSGGCLLTDPGFSRRIKDLFKYSELTLQEAELAKIGRHFRINEKLKLVVGRNERENQRLLELGKDGDAFFSPLIVPGPTAVARGLNGDLAEDKICASIVSRYCDGQKAVPIAINKWRSTDKEKGMFFSLLIPEAELEKLRI